MQTSQFTSALRGASAAIRRQRHRLGLSPATQYKTGACLSCACTARRGVSLSDLASAFSELGKASATSPSRSSEAGAPARDAGDAKSSRARNRLSESGGGAQTDDAHSSPSSHHNTRTRTGTGQGTGHRARCGASSSSSTPTATTTTTAAHTARPSSVTVGLATFSLSYSRHLAELDVARLTAEVEEQHRRQHFGHMVSCLIDIHFRLTDLLQAHGGAGCTFDRLGHDDRLLLAALSCLTKLDLTEIESELESWVTQLARVRETGLFKEAPASGPASTLSHRDDLRHAVPPHAQAFLTSFCDVMQRWMLARVSEMDAGKSVACMHLLAQQKLFFSDALLATLADNVETRHATRSVESLLNLSDSSSSPVLTTSPASLESSHDVMPLDICAVLLDVLARYQASVLTALRIIDRPVIIAGAFPSQDEKRDEAAETLTAVSSPSLEASTDTTWSRAGQGSSSTRHLRAHALATVLRTHPILNERFFTVCAEALVQSLHYASELETKTTGSDARTVLSTPRVIAWTGHNVTRFAQLPPASFFFLTRALAKLRFFHTDVVPALLPHLAGYLRQHPEQYLGPILLLGRPENQSIEVEVARVLLQNVNSVLRRRGDTYQREMASQQHAQHARAASTAASMSTAAHGAAGTATAFSSETVETAAPADLLLSDPLHDSLEDELLSFHEDALPVPRSERAHDGDVDVEDADKSAPGDAMELRDGSAAARPPKVASGIEDNEALQYRAHRGRMALSQQIARARAQVALASHLADENHRQHPQRVSLIALHASPTFLASVFHLYRLAWEHAATPASGARCDEASIWAIRAELVTDMGCLYRQLLDDLDHGLPRQLEVLTRSMPPSAVEGLLQLLLDVRETLMAHLALVDAHARSPSRSVKVGVPSPVSGSNQDRRHTSIATTGASTARGQEVDVKKSKQSNNDDDREAAAAGVDDLREWLAVPHSLLVVLTFLWTQQIRRRPLPRAQSQVPVDWCPSTRALTHALLAAGLLMRREVRHGATEPSPSPSYRSHRSARSSSAVIDDEVEAVFAPTFRLHFIPESLLLSTPCVEELVQRAKLTKLLGLRDAQSHHGSQPQQPPRGRHGRFDASTRDADPVVREVRNSAVFFPFSRRVEFAESGRA